METINSSKDIQSAIFCLQQKRDQLRVDIENQIDSIHENLSPAHILKRTINNLVDSDGLKTKSASAALGLGSGLIAQKIVTGKSKNIFRNLLGTIVQIAVTGLVAKNSNKLTSTFIKPGRTVFGNKPSRP